MPSIQTTIARELNLTAAQVAAVIDLVDQGNTIPFIARYRKEATGGIDDATLRDLDERLATCATSKPARTRCCAPSKSRASSRPTCAEDREATVMQRVEDLYKPYRKKRATRASKARDAGLEPLALLILAQDRSAKDPLAVASGLVNPEAGYPTPEDALQGAQDIVAEVVADDAEHVACLRAATKRNGALSVEAVDASEKT
ncbi:MAG: Tex-like N-terminal domain-containing protein, partial [Eggerthella lenta]